MKKIIESLPEIKGYPVMIREKIKAALERSPYIDASGITVDFEDGKVILNGKVRSGAERGDIECIVNSFTAVTALENNLKLEITNPY